MSLFAVGVTDEKAFESDKLSVEERETMESWSTQEILTWGEDYILNDCFSLFGRNEGREGIKTKKIVSKNFMEKEVWWAKNIIHKYGHKNDDV